MKDAVVALLGSSSSVALRPHSANLNRTSTYSNPRTLCSSSSSSHTPPEKTRTRARTRTRKRILLNTFGFSRSRNGSLKYSAKLASKLAEEGKLDDFLMIAETILADSSSASRSEFASLLNLDLISSGVSLLLQPPHRFPTVVRVLTCLVKLGLDVPRLLNSLLHTLDLHQLLIFIQTLQEFNFAIEELVELSGIIRRCVNDRNPSAAIRYIGWMK